MRGKNWDKKVVVDSSLTSSDLLRAVACGAFYGQRTEMSRRFNMQDLLNWLTERDKDRRRLTTKPTSPWTVNGQLAVWFIYTARLARKTEQAISRKKSVWKSWRIYVTEKSPNQLTLAGKNCSSLFKYAPQNAIQYIFSPGEQGFLVGKIRVVRVESSKRTWSLHICHSNLSSNLDIRSILKALQLDRLRMTKRAPSEWERERERIELRQSLSQSCPSKWMAPHSNRRSRLLSNSDKYDRNGKTSLLGKVAAMQCI